MQHIDQEHLVPGIYPVADFMSGTVYTDIVECAGSAIVFDVVKGVGATGTSTITVEACSTIAAAASTAVAFYYRESTTPDTWGAWTAATTTGFTTTAGSNQAYQVYVPAGQLASEGYKYARLKAVEVANDPVVGCINVRVVGLNYAPQPTSLID